MNDTQKEIKIEALTDAQLLKEVEKRIKDKRLLFGYDGREQRHSDYGCCSYDYLWWDKLYSKKEKYELDFHKLDPIMGDYGNADKEDKDK